MGDNDQPVILVLEDDEAFGQLLKETLEEEGYSVSLHNRFESAIEFAQTKKVDLVISDLFIEERGQISKQGGITLISRLKQILSHPAPIIAISGSFSHGNYQHTVSSAMTVGAARALAKPVDPEELIATVNHYLRGAAKA